MHRKKLVTFACALGILACGACFLPPPGPPPYRPKIAPLHIDLRGAKRIRVQVANTSPMRHLDTRELANDLVTAINYRDGGTPVKAIATDKFHSTDAVLQVVIVDESGEPAPAGRGGFSYRITMDATLTRPDGTVVWHPVHRPYLVPTRIPITDEGQMWKSRFNYVPFEIARALTRQMFDGI